jgi:hypothetical protein
MGDAIVILKWTPAQFWGATMHELQAAVEALRRAHPPEPGAKKHGG